MAKDKKYMSFMSTGVIGKPQEDSVKDTECDKRFARPDGFKLDMTFKEHMERIWKRNAVSMDKLSK